MSASRAVVRSVLSTDPIWAAYALADIQPAFEPYCRWLATVTAPECGLILFFSGLEPTILMSVGQPATIAKLLSAASTAGGLPERVYLSIREDHLPVVERFYDSSADRRSMMRMVCRQVLSPVQTTADVRRLGVDDIAGLTRLYAHGGSFTPDAFEPYQLTAGVFFGIDDGGELAAAGGTHIVNRVEGVAAIGNIYTRPDCRGRGYAKIVTTAIAATLQAEGIGNIVLNVDQRNTAARALYRTVGFEEYCAFYEGAAEKRRLSDAGT